MGVRVGRIHPVQWFSFHTGAHDCLAWFTVRVWRWEFDAQWRY